MTSLTKVGRSVYECVNVCEVAMSAQPVDEEAGQVGGREREKQKKQAAKKQTNKKL